MRKKWRGLTVTVIISMMLSVFLLAGCAGEPKEKEIPLSQLVDLSPANISTIGISQNGGPQTVIDNPEQIEKVCSFLSSAFTLENQYTETPPSNPQMVGGMGDYILIRYSNKGSAHMRIGYKSETDRTAARILLLGNTKQGEIK